MFWLLLTESLVGKKMNYMWGDKLHFIYSNLYLNYY